MENSLLDFEVSIEKDEYGQLPYFNQKHFTITLIILNKSSIDRKFILSAATYITKNREQLRQDNWQLGLFEKEGIIHANSFMKAGLIFFIGKLKEINNGDIIICTLTIEEEGKEIIIDFNRENGNWKITKMEVKDKVILLAPTQLSKVLLKKIERLEVFEEQCEVYFDKMSSLDDVPVAGLIIAG